MHRANAFSYILSNCAQSNNIYSGYMKYIWDEAYLVVCCPSLYADDTIHLRHMRQPRMRSSQHLYQSMAASASKQVCCYQLKTVRRKQQQHVAAAWYCLLGRRPPCVRTRTEATGRLKLRLESDLCRVAAATPQRLGTGVVVVAGHCKMMYPVLMYLLSDARFNSLWFDVYARIGTCKPTSRAGCCVFDSA